MHRLTLALVCSISAFVHAQNVSVTFPCTGQVNGKSCSSGDKLPDGSLRVVSPDDYYSISIESACIDRPGTFWKKKIVSFSVQLSGISKDPLTIPVYSDQAPQGCRLGVNGFDVMDSIPSNGRPVGIKVNMQREDDQDGLKQILSMASSGSIKNSLTTYAVSALPFVSIASDFVNQAYQSFKVRPDEFLSSAPFTLVSESGSANRFTLRDGYVLLYQGNDSLNDGSVYVDSGEVKRISDGSPLRGGATWVLFKISKGKHRTDYSNRTWYEGWQNAVLKATSQQLNSDGIKTQFQQAVTLLQADGDFTQGDKAFYIQQFNRVELAILTELAKPTPDYSAMQEAVQKATEDVKFTKVQPGEPALTATNSTTPTAVASPVSVATRAVVPDKVADSLTKVAARAQ